MAWVQFSRKYNWRASGKGQSFVTYPPGRFSVKRKCAEDAVSAGAATLIDTPKRATSGADLEGDMIDGPGSQGG